MKKQDIKLIEQIFNLNVKSNGIFSLLTLTAIYFVATLNFLVLAMIFNDFIRIGICLVLAVSFFIGTILGAIIIIKQTKERDNILKKIRKITHKLIK